MSKCGPIDTGTARHYVRYDEQGRSLPANQKRDAQHEATRGRGGC